MRPSAITAERPCGGTPLCHPAPGRAWCRCGRFRLLDAEGSSEVKAFQAQAVKIAHSRTAFFPVNSSHLWMMTSQLRSSISIIKAVRPSCSAARRVVPLPPKKSPTVQPGLLELFIKRPIRGMGFMVGCWLLFWGFGSKCTVVRSLYCRI